MAVSPSPTLVAPSDDLKSLLFLPGAPSQVSSASDLIEFLASCAAVSSAVYVYDVAEQIGFGTLTKSWGASLEHSAPVIPLQTRAGAGLSLVGRLSEGTSQDTINGAVLTAYTTPVGLAAMAPSLAHLPAPSSRSRLIVQVPAVTPVGDAFTLSPTLASLSTSFTIFPDSLAIILSATPQESVDLALLAYKLNNWHVVHIFDHHSAAREVGHNFVLSHAKDVSDLSILDAVRMTGYAPFEFVGDPSARTVFVLLNGPLALVVKALVSRTVGAAAVIVRVFRPWGADEFQKMVPSTAKEVYVFDDVPHETTRGPLFADVFASLYDPTRSAPIIRAQRVTPDKAKEFISDPTQFCSHLASLFDHFSADLGLESAWTKLAFFSTPSNDLTVFRQLIADTLSRGISIRRLTDHDVFSRAGGMTVDRIVLSPKKACDNFVPISLALPLNGSGLTDFMCIIEPHLLGSHYILECAKPGSAVLVVTSWSSAELLGSIPAQVSALVLQRKIRLYTIDAKTIASELCEDTTARETTESLVIYLAFLRLYLGKASNQAVLRKLAVELVPDDFREDAFSRINARTWELLLRVEFPADHESTLDTATNTISALRHFEFNTIAVDTGAGQTVYNGSKVTSWHEAAKHLLFASVFTPLLPVPPVTEDFPQIPSLHPELSERTYLVTCTVNRRLTPLDYDRNVFHVEFNTEGTGLKYAIGEALGIHGWNDAKEVLDFCGWYGVDPDRVITIPTHGGEKMHSRTIIQILQQQIDLFGEPPKSFYTDLAQYATEPVEKLALQFIGSPEGSSTFKKLNEKDTVTFAEVLERYRSAKPGIETLCEMIGDIKPRHYSIASAQSVVGNRVDLLVVTVEWTAPSGE